MAKASLYVVYHFSGENGVSGCGYATTHTDADYENDLRPLRLSEIATIQEKVLKHAQDQDPRIKSLFLMSWTWAAPEMGAA